MARVNKIRDWIAALNSRHVAEISLLR